MNTSPSLNKELVAEYDLPASSFLRAHGYAATADLLDALSSTPSALPVEGAEALPYKCAGRLNDCGQFCGSSQCFSRGTPSKEGAGQVEADQIVTTIKTELDALGRLWMNYGKQAGGFNPESGALYGQIQFTRNKVLDYLAMLAPPPPASPSEGGPTDEQFWEWWRATNKDVHTGDILKNDIVFFGRVVARAVLSLSPSRGEAVDAARYRVIRHCPSMVMSFGRWLSDSELDAWLDSAIQSKGAKP